MTNAYDLFASQSHLEAARNQYGDFAPPLELDGSVMGVYLHVTGALSSSLDLDVSGIYRFTPDKRVASDLGVDVATMLDVNYRLQQEGYRLPEISPLQHLDGENLRDAIDSRFSNIFMVKDGIPAILGKMETPHDVLEGVTLLGLVQHVWAYKK